MKQISSFTVNHLNLLPGIYVSRVDQVGEETITTFDIRMKRPNVDVVMTTTSMHTIEHLGATYLRNHAIVGKEIIYFGPMGCRTGFYLIMAGKKSAKDVLALIKDMMMFICEFEGDIPGASAIECGNYTDLDLTDAKKDALAYQAVLNTNCPLNYPL